jgi:hypothetical protein
MKARLGLLVVATIGLASTTAPQATAQSLKCKPFVHVTNNKPAAIKVTKFLYKVAGSNDVNTESLNNKRLAPRERGDWPHQTLKEAATGVVVTSTAVEYKNDNSGAGDGWGPPHESHWFPPWVYVQRRAQLQPGRQPDRSVNPNRELRTNNASEALVRGEPGRRA